MAQQWLLSLVRKSKIFRRRGTPIDRRVDACLFYFSGLSYREIAYVLKYVDVSHEAVRKWVKRLSKLISQPEPKMRRCVAIDETKLKEDGVQIFVWAAMDVDTREVRCWP